VAWLVTGPTCMLLSRTIWVNPTPQELCIKGACKLNRLPGSDVATPGADSSDGGAAPHAAPAARRPAAGPAPMLRSLRRLELPSLEDTPPLALLALFRSVSSLRLSFDSPRVMRLALTFALGSGAAALECLEIAGGAVPLRGGHLQVRGQQLRAQGFEPD
jgi:hypothetical protein